MNSTEYRLRATQVAGVVALIALLVIHGFEITAFGRVNRERDQQQRVNYYLDSALNNQSHRLDQLEHGAGVLVDFSVQAWIKINNQSEQQFIAMMLNEFPKCLIDKAESSLDVIEGISLDTIWLEFEEQQIEVFIRPTGLECSRLSDGFSRTYLPCDEVCAEPATEATG